MGLSYDHVRKCGALVVAWDEDEYRALADMLVKHQRAGDEDVRMVEVDELRSLEPAMSYDALGALLCPNEAVVRQCITYFKTLLELVLVHFFAYMFDINSIQDLEDTIET